MHQSGNNPSDSTPQPWTNPAHAEAYGVELLNRYKKTARTLYALCIFGGIWVWMLGWVLILHVSFVGNASLLFNLLWLFRSLAESVGYFALIIGFVVTLLLSVVSHTCGTVLLVSRSAMSADRWISLGLSFLWAGFYGVLAGYAMSALVFWAPNYNVRGNESLVVFAFCATVQFGVPGLFFGMAATRRWTSRRVIVMGFWLALLVFFAVGGAVLSSLHGTLKSLLVTVTLVVGIFAVISVVVLQLMNWLHQEQLRMMIVPLCRNCGYDVSGSVIAGKSECPECGKPIPRARRRWLPTGKQ
jgi:predicted RNA-binding Zn-ribbon protein involved in translation (DUF1610 family)